MNEKRFTLNVNGKKYKITAREDETLLWALRDKLGLTGTKFGCGEGTCGSCTVVMNGHAVRSCVMPLAGTVGAKITTIEGLEKDGSLSPLQQAFIDFNAFCCGFCTPGMIMAATALLEQNPHPTEEDIARALEGNACRCASYPNITKAILHVAGQEKGDD